MIERMNRTVRDILAQIDDVFARGGKHPYAYAAADRDARYFSPQAEIARQLWDVLSALRGPDSEVTSEKTATTCIIRAACFPKTFGKGMRSIAIPASMGYDEVDHERKRATMTGHHFRSHAKKAFDVLGLSWDNVNSPMQINNAAKPFRKKLTTKKATPRAAAAFKARKALGRKKSRS